MRYMRIYSWDLVGLDKYIKRELIPELCDKGEAIIDYYIIWREFGLGRYEKRDKQFIKKCDAVLKNVFRAHGLDISIQHKRNGYGILRVRL